MLRGTLQKAFVQDTRDSRLVTRRVAGETILVPVSSRVGDLEAIYTLNTVGTRIWEMLATPTPLSAIVGTLKDEYDVSVEEATADVAGFLEELASCGFIREAGDEGTS